MRFKEKFSIDVRNQGVDQLAKDLHKHLIAKVERGLAGIAEMQRK